MDYPAGWYDDPNDPRAYRYWDGTAWTAHVTPKEPPPVAPQPGERTEASGPAAPTTQYGQYGQSGQYGQYGQPRQYEGQYGQSGQYGAGGSQLSSSSQPWPQQRMSAAGPSTPDGVPLASWWSRVGARLLDVIFVSIIGLPVTGYFYYRYFGAYTTWMQQLSADASAGRPQFSFTLPNSVLHWLLVIAVLSIVVGVAYEAYFLRCSGATPGKQIAGISVRLRDTPGPMPMTAIWRRVGVMYGLGVLGDIPVVGVLFAIVNLLNYLWPLWDGKKQAWHDKVASTNVVQGPRAKPPAISPGWG